MRQWSLSITAYADQACSTTSKGSTGRRARRSMQRELDRPLRGRAEIDVRHLKSKTTTITVFTTRPDTLFGATYMVLAPEHPLVAKITTDAQRAAVDAVRPSVAKNKSDRERSRGPRSQEEDRRVHGRRTRSTRSTARRSPCGSRDYVLWGLRDGRDHGGARARRARLRVSRSALRAADRAGDRRRRKAGRCPTSRRVRGL
jgi:leucyl-tRNA synthetase